VELFVIFSRLGPLGDLVQEGFVEQVAIAFLVSQEREDLEVGDPPRPGREIRPLNELARLSPELQVCLLKHVARIVHVTEH
jgi:hypothetical protein